MKFRKSLLVLFGFLTIFTFFGCSQGGDSTPPQTYTVWTDEDTAEKFNEIFGTEQPLEKNTYKKMTYKGNDFQKWVEESFIGVKKYTYTKDQIISYFINLGYDSDEAVAPAEWLISIEHGMVASRLNGDTVYMILK